MSLAALVGSTGGIDAFVRAVFEASAHSATSPYGLGVHVFNTSLDLSYAGGYESAAHDAVSYAFENGVVQTAARAEDSSVEPSLGGVPAGYEPSWIISVGGSVTDKTRSPSCDYGETMDLLAPSGDNEFGNCGPPNLN